MEPTPAASRDASLDGATRDALDALADAAARIRDLHERSRATCQGEQHRWEALRERLDALEREVRAGGGTLDRETARTLAAEHDALTAALGHHRSELSRLELVRRSIESAATLLASGPGGRGNDEDEDDGLPVHLRLRLVEAQEAERLRLAREIHDGPAQALSNAIFQADLVERLLARDPEAARTELVRLREHLQRDLADVRGYLTQLRPPRLLELGLEGAIAELADALAATTGIEVDRALDAPAGLDEGARTVALRVVQEALQNIRKHSGARHVTISSTSDGVTWSLEIRDDGRGFSAGEAVGRDGRHFGLGFMRERARLIGAALAVRSDPGAGTTVTLTIPMRER